MKAATRTSLSRETWWFSFIALFSFILLRDIWAEEMIVSLMRLQYKTLLIKTLQFQLDEMRFYVIESDNEVLISKRCVEVLHNPSFKRDETCRLYSHLLSHSVAIKVFFSSCFYSHTIFRRQSKIRANRVSKAQSKDFIGTIYSLNQQAIVKCWLILMSWVFVKHWKRN